MIAMIRRVSSCWIDPAEVDDRAELGVIERERLIRCAVSAANQPTRFW